MRKLLIIALVLLFLTTWCSAQTATPIVVPADQTDIMLAGKVPEGAMQVFTYETQGGQPFGAYVMSGAKNAAFEITGPDGKMLGQSKSDKFGGQEWKGVLQSAGMYTIVVYSNGGLADFQMTVTTP